MDSPVNRFLSGLDGVTPAGDRRWMACCPAHDDKNPSLSVAVGDNGGALVHCHAGCTTDDVLASMGKRRADLMPNNGHAGNGKGHANGHKPRANGKAPKVYPSPRDAVAGLTAKHGVQPRHWVYRNLDGQDVGASYRWDVEGGKIVRPVSRFGDGWALKAMDAPRPLLNLPELLASDDYVFVVEGEPCVDVIRSLKLLGTTSSGGSKAARFSDWSVLAGRDVIILVDNDDPGRAYGQEVAKLLWAAGAHEIRVVELPDLPPGGDVADWVAEHSDQWRERV